MNLINQEIIDGLIMFFMLTQNKRQHNMQNKNQRQSLDNKI